MERYFHVTGEEVHHVALHLGEVVEVQAIALRPQEILLQVDHRFDLAVGAHELALEDEVEGVVDEGDGSWIRLAVPSASRKKMGDASLIILGGCRGTRSSCPRARGSWRCSTRALGPALCVFTYV